MNNKIDTKVELHCIFPTTVYRTNVNPNLNKKQTSVVNNYLSELRLNEGNKLSINSFVLDNKNLKNFKNQLLFFVKDYMYNVLKYDLKVIPYITQSWFNITDTNQFHHRHAHPNSFISGVFYFNADYKYDNISVYKPGSKYFHLDPVPKYMDYYNANEWIFPVKTYDLILFPSFLEHKVDHKKGNNNRISLAFNTFLKGEIGEKRRLSFLKL